MKAACILDPIGVENNAKLAWGYALWPLKSEKLPGQLKSREISHKTTPRQPHVLENEPLIPGALTL
jgi:hypothetical protein